MNKLIGLGISSFLVFLLLFGCTQTNVDENDSNDYNGLANAVTNNTQEITEVLNPAFGGALGEFSNLVAKSANLSYMVKMDISNGTGTQSMTKYVSGSNVRFDAEGDGVISRIYFLPSGSFVCFFNAGEWMCIESPKTSDEYQPYEYDKKLIEDSQTATTLIKVESKTILGMQTECFANSANVDARNIFCLNQKGVMLYIESANAEMPVKYTAIEYAEQVNSDVFTLPAEVTSFPQ